MNSMNDIWTELVFYTAIFVSIFLILYLFSSILRLKAANKAIISLDCVVNGHRIIGVNSEVIKMKYGKEDNGTMKVVELCKSGDGIMFKHIFWITELAKVTDQHATLIDELEATQWLAEDNTRL